MDCAGRWSMFMHRVPRRRSAGGLFLALLLSLALLRVPSSVEAAPPGDSARAPALGQRLPRTCEELQPLLRQVELADTSLVTAVPEPGGAGARACVFLDRQTEQPHAWLLTPATVDQFRAVKGDVAGLLAERGVDPCALMFWSSVSNAVQSGLNFADAHDAGRACDPVVEARGSRGEAQAAVVRAALADAMRAADEQFGWRLTWPLQVQVWDDDTGIRNRGQVTMPEAINAAGEAGVTSVGTYSRTRILLDLSKIDTEEELRAVVVHEYGHIVQHGITGCTCNLPFWAVEGGAEYFASLVVGPRSPALADRFQEARDRVRTSQARPLASLADQQTVDALQSYSRGYAAMQFLADRWSGDAVVRLLRDNVDGSAARYQAALEATTGMSPDGFDSALNDWLAAHRGYAPAPGPNTTLLPDHRVFTLKTGNLLDDTFVEQSIFGPAENTVDVWSRWDCLGDEPEVQWSVFAPDGTLAARYRGQTRAGCFSSSSIRIALDDHLGSGPPRARPGTWRVEVALRGQIQGSVTFTIE